MLTLEEPIPPALLADPIEPPKPNGLDLRRRGRHPGPRVVQRLPLLFRLRRADHGAFLRRPGRAHVAGLLLRRRRRRARPVRHEPLLPVQVRALDRRAVRRPARLHIDVDAILWLSEGLMG